MENGKPSIVRLPDQILTSVLAHKEAYTLFVTNLSVIREHLIADLLLRKRFGPLPFYAKFERKNLSTKEAFDAALQSVFEYLVNNGVLSAEQARSCTLHFQQYSYRAIYDLAGIPWRRKEFGSTLYGDREITPAVHYVLKLLDVFFGHLIAVYEELIGANEALHKEYLPRRNLALTEWSQLQSHTADRVKEMVPVAPPTSHDWFHRIMAKAGYRDVTITPDGLRWAATRTVKTGPMEEAGEVSTILMATSDPALRHVIEAKKALIDEARRKSGFEDD